MKYGEGNRIGKQFGANSFRSRAPWWGGDLQTLRNRIVRHEVSLPGLSKRLFLAMADGSGDQLAAMLHVPDNVTDSPLVVLIHGLTGSEDSDYLRQSAAFHLKRGYRVLRLNLRGAGPSRSSSGGQYHSGCATDLRDALMALDYDLTSQGVFLIGFSLGGNILINLLAAHCTDLPVFGAVTVSAALDPAQATKRIMAPRNVLYHRWLLRHMRRECLALGARLEDQERHAILRARTIYEFDNTFTAPRNGFSGADEYYTGTAGWRVAPKIVIPTLLIHARNDPWIPSDPYEHIKQTAPTLRVNLVDGGGHVGFHGRGHDETWHDRCAGEFFDSLW